MPCRMIEPAVKKLGDEYAERVDVWKLNADEHASLVPALGVRGIPTLIAYHNGQESACSSGAQPQAGSAVYNRCPIWRAVSARLGRLLRPEASAGE